MPKFARLVVPGYPHHVTQRGIRKQRTFFDNSDCWAYINLVARLKTEAGVKIWSYCLMPNHVHVIAVPSDSQGLAKLFGLAHQRYAKRINARHDWHGHLWQARFSSVVMDERHTLAAMRYIELNPVRAGLCDEAELWPWSSVHAHLGKQVDRLVDDCQLINGVENWAQFLDGYSDSKLIQSLRTSTSNGRPVGDARFINRLEARTGRQIRRRKPGPEPCK